MAKLSDKINLSKAVQKANIATDSGQEENPVEELLNAGVKASRKRRSKKKEESVPAPVTEENSLFAELLPQETPEQPQGEKWPKTYDEMCEYELRKAQERNLPEPDFDFRGMYAKGQKVWFVRVLGPLGEKEMLHVTIRTVYPRMLIVVEQKAYCHCVGYNMRDQIFDTEYHAQAYFDTVKVSKKYSTEPVRVKSYEYEDEDSDMSTSQEAYEELMKEED